MPERVEPDLIGLLTADHAAIGASLARFEQVRPEERRDYFEALVPVLVAHEVAEEQIVYPALRALGEQVGVVVEARLEEQSRAEQLLAEMEGLDPAAGAFARSMEDLRTMVLAHAAAEGRDVFPLLEDNQDTLDLPTMAVRYQNAKRRAPTHPHPHAPDAPPGNLTLGPLTSLVDRVRDALG